jgi:enoyl-CoA hydratase
MAGGEDAEGATVRVDVQDRVATVTLDRPPVNALDQATFRALGEAFEAISASRDASVAILTGAGARAFCAGVDLHDSPRRYDQDARAAGRVDDQLDPGKVVRDCFWALYDCAVPVIAAVNGAAIGAGFALVTMCDLIVCGESAGFGLTEVNVGVLGGARHVQRMVGSYRMRSLFFTGRVVGPRELSNGDCIEAIVPDDQLQATARSLAEAIASKSPIGLRLAKESMNRVEFLDLKTGYRTEQDYTARVRGFADSDEARRAYLEKRESTFHWR